MGLETHFQIFRPIGLVIQFPNWNKPQYTIPTNIRYLAIYSIFRNTNSNNYNNSDTIIHISVLTIFVVVFHLKFFIELKFTFDSKPIKQHSIFYSLLITLIVFIIILMLLITSIIIIILVININYE